MLWNCLCHWLNERMPIGQQMDLAAEEIDHLLKRGAYDVFREDDEEGKDFVEANIDDIMKRAATKVTVPRLVLEGFV